MNIARLGMVQAWVVGYVLWILLHTLISTRSSNTPYLRQLHVPPALSFSVDAIISRPAHTSNYLHYNIHMFSLE